MFYSGRKVLVTGGAGFLGSHMVDALVHQGAEVTVVDSLYAGVLNNLAGVRQSIQFEKIDIRDYDAIEACMKGQDTVFHYAANASVPNSVKNPLYDFETNAKGTFNICQAAINTGVRKVVFASSAAVYGEPEYVPVDEKHPLQPISPYGATKVCGEKVGIAFVHSLNLDFSIIRIYNTYGPRQPRYVIHDFIRKLQRDSSHLEVLGDGSNIRDYSHVSDTIRAFLLIGQTEGTCGEAYNVAGGRPISIKELAALIIDMWHNEPTRITYTGESWPGDIKSFVANTTKIRNLGFIPQMKLEDGVRDMIDWFLEYSPEGEPSV